MSETQMILCSWSVQYYILYIKRYFGFRCLSPSSETGIYTDVGYWDIEVLRYRDIGILGY